MVENCKLLNSEITLHEMRPNSVKDKDLDIS